MILTKYKQNILTKISKLDNVISVNPHFEKVALAEIDEKITPLTKYGWRPVIEVKTTTGNWFYYPQKDPIDFIGFKHMYEDIKKKLEIDNG